MQSAYVAPPPRGFAPEVTPPPGVTVSPTSAEVRHEQAKVASSNAGRQHAMASSKSSPSSPHTHQQGQAKPQPRTVPYMPPKPPEKPPLGGSTSLREALERATGRKVESASHPGPQRNSPYGGPQGRGSCTRSLAPIPTKNLLNCPKTSSVPC